MPGQQVKANEKAGSRNFPLSGDGMIHKCGKLIEDAGAAYDRKDHLDSIRMITQQGVVFDWSTNSVQLMFRISNSEEKSAYPV